MLTKSVVTLRTQHSFWQFFFLKLLDEEPHFKWVSVTSQSPLARSSFPESTLTTGFSSAFWRAFFGQGKAHISVKMSRNQFSIAASLSAAYFARKMPLSAISKIWAFKKIFMWSLFSKISKNDRFFMLTKSTVTIRTHRSFWQFAVSLKMLDQELHFIWVSVTSKSPSHDLWLLNDNW